MGVVAIAAGGRTQEIGQDFWPLLDEQARGWDIEEIWHGGATGADEGVHQWALYRGLRVEVFPAPWELFKKAKIRVKAAGARRIEDMLGGRRGYRQSGTEVKTMEQLDGAPTVALILPGHQGTRRTARRCREKGIIVERLSLEPMVINHYHYSGKGDQIPTPHRWIQRGRSALANPHLSLLQYRRWLWKEIKDKRGPAFEELQQIRPTEHLVCSCVRADGRVTEEGKGACHGHVVVAAWKWLHHRTSAQPS